MKKSCVWCGQALTHEQKYNCLDMAACRQRVKEQERFQNDRADKAEIEIDRLNMELASARMNLRFMVKVIESFPEVGTCKEVAKSQAEVEKYKAIAKELLEIVGTVQFAFDSNDSRRKQLRELYTKYCEIRNQ